MNGFYFQTDYWDAACTLPEKQRDKFIAALVRYYFTGEEPQLRGNATGMFALVKKRIDIGRKRAEYGSKGGSKSQAKRKQNEDLLQQVASSKTASNASHREKESEKEIKETPSKEGAKKGFAPPTAEEVAEYIGERGYAVDADRFIDFYASKGWMVGKNKMKDWKAAVRNWARRDTPSSTPSRFDYGEDAW
ncbi:MAG: hypothetical protein IJF97_00675 [Eggerthellaceae bacterium]|nr:hypothetical protein [Eggerthellaceae bacterium]MBQ3342694.1 hypothetical protein [Kiritimatiellia bacterium]